MKAGKLLGAGCGQMILGVIGIPVTAFVIIVVILPMDR